MKPRTKRQHLIVDINKSLPKITKIQKEWAFKECLPHTAIRRKSGKIICLDCSNVWNSSFKQGWKDEVCKETCSKCKTELNIHASRKTVFYEETYIGIIQVHKKHQVVRIFEIIANYRVGIKKRTHAIERSRVYINETGEYEIIGYSYGNSYTGGTWSNGFNLKQPRTINNHTITPYFIYPKISTLKIIRRNGFKTSFRKLAPINLFRRLLTNPLFESLWKLKQFKIIDYLVYNYSGERKIKEHLSSVKLAIKNNYVFKDVGIWFDYLSLLEFFGRDLLNIKYICPNDCMSEHNRLLKRKRDIERKEKIKELKVQLRKDQRKYLKEKRKFFSLKFISGNLIIEPIKSAKQLMLESDELLHCAFTNGYHNDNNKLLFSAKVNNKVLETIDVNLFHMKISQSRGINNSTTQYSKQIRELVDNNMFAIKEILNPKPKRKIKLKKAV